MPRVVFVFFLLLSLFSFANGNFKVMNGQPAAITQFPWLAQLHHKRRFICGGVIVSERVVLTAAHCVFWKKRLQDPAPYKVLLGSSYTSHGDEYSICRFLPFPQYNELSQYQYFYDLALMLLHKYIIFVPCCVQKATIIPNSEWRRPGNTLAVAGYGMLKENAKKVSQVLQVTYLYYIANEQCNNSYSEVEAMPVHNSMFCLIANTATGDCYGDSGSGVMWGSYVIGLVGTGRIKECGSTSVPSMHTSLSYFRTWIYSSVAYLEATPCNNYMQQM